MDDDEFESDSRGWLSYLRRVLGIKGNGYYVYEFIDPRPKLPFFLIRSDDSSYCIGFTAD